MRPPSNITAMMSAGIKNHSEHSHEHARENDRSDSHEWGHCLIGLTHSRIWCRKLVPETCIKNAFFLVQETCNRK